MKTNQNKQVETQQTQKSWSSTTNYNIETKVTPGYFEFRTYIK
jgi:hypothetical protein